MYIRASKKWQNILEFTMVVIGTLIMGFAFSVFLEPNNISTGGFSALSMVINTLLSKVGVVGIPTSAIYLILNIGLYILALKTLGKRFAIKALVGILSFSLGMQLFDMIPFNITYELLISAVFGGFIMGIGVGLVVRFGGSTGGSDMIACIIKSKRPHATLGSSIILVDMFIIALTLFVFENGFVLLPYTIIALLFCMFVTDFINEGYKEIRAFNIITDKPNEISNAIMEQLNRGCSCMSTKGMHTNKEKSIVLCLVSKYQAGQLRTIITDIDPFAFVYTTRVSEVMGEWYKVANTTEKK